MPERRTDEAVHIVMTDHHILRVQPSAEDRLAEKGVAGESPATPYRGEVVPFYPGFGASGHRGKNGLDEQSRRYAIAANLEGGVARLAGLIQNTIRRRAAYYAGLAEGYFAAGDSARGISFYEQAMKRAPASTGLALRIRPRAGGIGARGEKRKRSSRALQRERPAMAWRGACWAKHCRNKIRPQQPKRPSSEG